MNKMMFNDKYGLTQAVLDGRKTMTRRVIDSKYITPIVTSDRVVHVKKSYGSYHEYTDDTGNAWLAWSSLKIGEEVAIAQRYKDIRNIIGDIQDGKSIKFMAGWNNKMFVKPVWMPHAIKITNIKVERLQNISEEDCLREGIIHSKCVAPYGFHVGSGKWKFYRTPKDAFYMLFTKVCGYKTWNDNPLVFAYEFELIR